jgi:hypothetical protein
LRRDNLRRSADELRTHLAKAQKALIELGDATLDARDPRQILAENIGSRKSTCLACRPRLFHPVSCRSPYHRPNSKVRPFEIWTDAASAENAFRSGLVTWENDPRPPNAAVDSIAIGPLRPQLPSNSQRMCLLLALRFARPSRAPAPRRPRTQQDHLPSATLFDSGFPKSWALSRQCASIPFGNF